MHKELREIDYVFYFKKNKRYVSIIELATNDTVENTKELWSDAAYSNALIFLNNQITHALYLINKDYLKDFNPIVMNRKEQENFLRNHAKIIITR